MSIRLCVSCPHEGFGFAHKGKNRRKKSKNWPHFFVLPVQRREKSALPHGCRPPQAPMMSCRRSTCSSGRSAPTTRRSCGRLHHADRSGPASRSAELMICARIAPRTTVTMFVGLVWELCAKDRIRCSPHTSSSSFFPREFCSDHVLWTSDIIF